MEQFTSAEAPLCSKAGEKPPQQASISSPPAVGQTIFHHGKEYTTVKEGLAFILVTPGERRTLDTKAHQAKLHGTGTREDGLPQDVFYNEIMQYNRDLSVLAIRAFGEDVLARPKRKRGRVKKGKKNLTKVAQKSGGNEEDEVAESAPKKQLETREGEECAERISKGPANENGPRSQGNEVILTSGDVNGTYASDSTAPVHNDGPDKEHGHTGDSKKRPRGEDEMDSADHGIAAKRAKTRDRTSATSDASKVVSYVLGQVQTLSQQGNNEGGTQSTQKDVSGLDETEVLDEDFIECERSMSRGGSFIEQDSQNIPTAPLKILDALSATGLRALRYAQELPFETSVTANDLSRNATKMIAANVEHNGLGSKINSVTGNAVAHMYQFVGQEGQGGHKTGYDVIDLDPYGTAVPFLDAAVQAARDGGLLCVTCTDTSVFMSNGYPEKAYSLYGGVPLKGSASHEGGLRLVLHAIATAGSRYGIAIEPLLSLSIDYYARVFVRVRRSAADVKFLAGKTMIVYNCDACHSLTPQWMGRNVRSEGKNNTTHWKHTFAQGPSVSQNCQHCGFKTHLNGPMWGGPLHNPVFIERILSYLPTLDKSTYGTADRLEGMLTTALEETTLFRVEDQPSVSVSAGAGAAKPNAKRTQPDQNSHNVTSSSPDSPLISAVPPTAQDQHPFYIFPNSLAGTLRCMAPSEASIKGALRHAGFHAVRTHAARGGIKTDAPWEVVWHIMREWIKQKAPVKEGALKEVHAGWRILHAGEHTVSDIEGKKPTEKHELHMDLVKEADGAEKQANGQGEIPTEIAGAKPKKDKVTAASIRFEVVFDEQLGKDKDKKKLKRFQLNPRANWGPMARAK